MISRKAKQDDMHKKTQEKVSKILIRCSSNGESTVKYKRKVGQRQTVGEGREMQAGGTGTWAGEGRGGQG